MMLSRTRTLDLNLKNEKGDLCLTHLTIFVEPDLPLAVVHYSVNGKESPICARIDLDKRAFLDSFPKPSYGAFAQSVAHKIVREVYRQVYAPPADRRRRRATTAHGD